MFPSFNSVYPVLQIIHLINLKIMQQKLTRTSIDINAQLPKFYKYLFTYKTSLGHLKMHWRVLK